MRRKITDDLQEWLASGRRTCPIVRGARQVGKTYVVNEFLRNNFENVLYIDLSAMFDARSAFDGDLDVDTVIMLLSAQYLDFPFVPGKTAIFLDEIQECPRAQTALRSFAQDGRYKVIASGSLLGLHRKEIPLIPMGYWEPMYLGPMDFEEFMWASGMSEDVIAHLRECISRKQPLGASLLNSLMSIFRRYAVVGGMPQAVSSFIESGTFNSVRTIQKAIISDYVRDMEKYADKNQINRIKACFRSIPAILGKENRRFLFTDIEDKPEYKVGMNYYGDALDWLDMAAIALFCENLTEVHEPLEERVKPSEFKAYLRDTGLLISMYSDNLVPRILAGDMGVNNGAIAENLMACMLHIQGRRLMYYGKREKRIEVDFVTSTADGITAIEVKSGANRRCSSLNKMVGDGIRGLMFETRDIFVDDKGIVHYPLFCAAFMDSIDPSDLPVADFSDIEELNRIFSKNDRRRLQSRRIRNPHRALIYEHKLAPSMDSERIAKFPFLKEAQQYVEDSGADIEDLITSPSYEPARARGMGRIMDTLKHSEVSYVPMVRASEYDRVMEVLSYPYARMIVSAVGDRFLTKRYALSEAVRMNKILVGEDRETVVDVSEQLNVQSSADIDGIIRMKFTDYLRLANRLKSVEWKLINTDIHSGMVSLPQDKFSRLMQNALQDKIESELPLITPDEFKPYLRGDITRATLALADAKARFSPSGGELKRDSLPPCIGHIMQMSRQGLNLPHSARFALVTFLNALGLQYEDIIKIFAESPDFDESKSEYQIKHIMGRGEEGYSPPECSTMKTNGLCYEPDSLCQQDWMTHPLKYYRAKTRDQKKAGTGPNPDPAKKNDRT